MRKIPPPKWVAWALSATVVFIAVFYAYRTVEQFLIGDPRFAFNQPDGQPDTDSLEISGAQHVPARAIENVFTDDFGKSVYLIPLSDRRASLRSVAWVKDSSVARFWPNRVVVGVMERKPVAYVSGIPGASGRPALIDDEGVLLPPVEDRFNLPVLTGIGPNDPLATRRDRVQRLLRLMKDLGDAAHLVAEADLSDPDDVKIREPFDGRTVTLLLGDRDFALRHQNFTRYYAEIRKKMPAAAILDLRVEDRITVVPPSGIPETQAVTQ